MNSTSFTIHEAYVTPSSAATWGPIRNAAAIPPSYSFTVAELAPGPWDGMAVSRGSLSTYYAYAWDLNVVAGQELDIHAVSGDFSGSLEVTNGNAYSITGLYVTPSSSPTWGPNQLSAPLATGSTFHLYDVPPDFYDVRCVHSSGGASEGYSYSISSFSVTSITCY